MLMCSPTVTPSGNTTLKKLIKRVERSGQRVIKVEADTAEFIAWCTSEGIGINAEGRMQFASFKAYQQLLSER